MKSARANRGPAGWTVGQARAEFAGLLHAAVKEPQAIYHRKRLRAVVVNPDAWRRATGGLPGEPPTGLAEAFAEIRKLAAKSNYVFPEIERRDRPNAFVKSFPRRPR